MFARAVARAPRKSAGRVAADATLMDSTTATPRLLNAFGTTRYTSFSSSGVSAALAGPVTDAAAAPSARVSDCVVVNVPRNCAGLSAAPTGTVTAACAA